MKPIKNLLNRIGDKQGFTMIELLVVISVIGVLAVAVLSSINPIEQINKGRDTRTRSDAAQLINAIDRYTAIHEEFPWNTTGAVATFNGAYGNLPTAWTGYDDTDWPNLLVTTSEVKDGFIDRQYDEAALMVLKPNGYDANVIVCFSPSSNAFRQEAADTCADYTGLGIPGIANNNICPTPGTISPSGAAQQNMICLP